MADNQQVSKAALMAGQTGPAAPAPPAKPAGEDITYIPGMQDPAQITWRGIVFKANSPVRVTSVDHIAAARGNKFFKVGSGEAATQAADTTAEPTTPEAYRAWVIDWLTSVKTVDDLLTKWSADQYLRQSASVGPDDIRLLGTIIDPKFELMQKQEDMSDAQVVKVLLSHGITQIPWRV